MLLHKGYKNGRIYSGPENQSKLSCKGTNLVKNYADGVNEERYPKKRRRRRKVK